MPLPRESPPLLSRSRVFLTLTLPPLICRSGAHSHRRLCYHAIPRSNDMFDMPSAKKAQSDDATRARAMPPPLRTRRLLHGAPLCRCCAERGASAFRRASMMIMSPFSRATVKTQRDAAERARDTLSVLLRCFQRVRVSPPPRHRRKI